MNVSSAIGEGGVVVSIITDGEGGVVGVEDSLSANKRVKQLVEVIDDRQREGRLRDLLRKYQKGGKNPRILVFALYKKEAERLEFSLRRMGWEVCSIHGNKHQAARTAALADFKSGKCPLMVATGRSAVVHFCFMRMFGFAGN